MKLKNKAILVGPFVGCYQWEMNAFAPYIISMIRQQRAISYIVFTRTSMFDLYGRYADILVPLNTPENKREELGYSGGIFQETYDKLCSRFEERYSKRYQIVNIIRPDLTGFMPQLQWQFTRSNLLFSFKPRKRNKEIISDFCKKEKYIVTDLKTRIDSTYDVIYLDDLYENLSKNEGFGKEFTFLGCVIELLKKASFYIGSFDMIYNLSLLLNVPTILTTHISGEKLSLLNPFKRKVIECSDPKRGIEYYENYF